MSSNIVIDLKDGLSLLLIFVLLYTEKFASCTIRKFVGPVVGKFLGRLFPILRTTLYWN